MKVFCSVVSCRGRAARRDEEVAGRGRRALLLPVASQASEQGPGQRHASVLGAVAYPDHQAVGVDVGRLEAQAFAEAQAERVDGAEGHPADGVLDGGEQRAHFRGAEHGGQHARLVDAKQLEHRPVATEGMGAEEAQGADGDVDARWRLLLLLAQEQEVGAHVLLGQLGRLGFRPVEKEPGGELVAALGARAVVAQAHVGAHAVAPVFQGNHGVLRGGPRQWRRGVEASEEDGFRNAARSATMRNVADACECLVVGGCMPRSLATASARFRSTRILKLTWPSVAALLRVHAA